MDSRWWQHVKQSQGVFITPNSILLSLIRHKVNKTHSLLHCFTLYIYTPCRPEIAQSASFSPHSLPNTLEGLAFPSFLPTGNTLWSALQKYQSMIQYSMRICLSIFINLMKGHHNKKYHLYFDTLLLIGTIVRHQIAMSSKLHASCS